MTQYKKPMTPLDDIQPTDTSTDSRSGLVPDDGACFSAHYLIEAGINLEMVSGARPSDISRSKGVVERCFGSINK